MWTISRVFCTRSFRNFGQLITRWAIPDEGRMPGVRSDHVAGKQVIRLATCVAVVRLYPQEILNGCSKTAFHAFCFVEVADFRLDFGGDPLRFGHKGCNIKRSQRLSNNPVRHWIDVAANHPHTEPIRFNQRGAASHERVRDRLIGKIMAHEEFIMQPFWPNSDSNKLRNNVPGRRANHLWTPMTGL